VTQCLPQFRKELEISSLCRQSGKCPLPPPPPSCAEALHRQRPLSFPGRGVLLMSSVMKPSFSCRISDFLIQLPGHAWLPPHPPNLCQIAMRAETICKIGRVFPRTPLHFSATDPGFSLTVFLLPPPGTILVIHDSGLRVLPTDEPDRASFPQPT